MFYDRRSRLIDIDRGYVVATWEVWTAKDSLAIVGAAAGALKE